MPFLLLRQSNFSVRTSSLSVPHRSVEACKSLSRHDHSTANLSTSIALTRHSEQTISSGQQFLSVDLNCFKAARLRRLYKFLHRYFPSPPTSPSRCSHRPTSALKNLFPLRSRGASFAHIYSPFICRFLSRPIHLICLAPSSPTTQLTHRSTLHLLKRNWGSLRSSSHSTSALSFAAGSLFVLLLPNPHNTRSCCGCASIFYVRSYSVGAAVSTEPRCTRLLPHLQTPHNTKRPAPLQTLLSPSL
jgi:hypothetical protein